MTVTRTSSSLPPLRPIERVLSGVIRTLSALPGPLQRALAGGAITRDGETLEPDLLLLRRLVERTERQRPASPAVLRRQQGSGARIGGGPVRDPLVTHDLVVEGPSGPLRARHYVYPGGVSPAGKAPLLVFLHGGGFVFGGVDSHDAPCRFLCRHAEMHVLSVEYRLAPESPFPAAVEDALAALRWAQSHASELGADPARVAIGGDSAGGNLAAVISQAAVEGGGKGPVAQLLVYPAADRTTAWRSVDTFATGFFLTRESIDWFFAQYVPADIRSSSAREPRVHPLQADDLRGLAPALVVTAGFDPLRDEGEAYAAALSHAGNDVILRRFGGQMHGFINLVGVTPSSRAATLEIATTFRALVARATSGAPA